jgi:hypothetical protein
MFLRNVGICLQKYTATKLKTRPASLLMIMYIREIKIKPFENIRNAVKEKRRRFRERHTACHSVCVSDVTNQAGNTRTVSLQGSLCCSYVCRSNDLTLFQYVLQVNPNCLMMTRPVTGPNRLKLPFGQRFSLASSGHAHHLNLVQNVLLYAHFVGTSDVRWKIFHRKFSRTENFPENFPQYFSRKFSVS